MTPLPIVLRDEVHDDIAQAAMWYEERRFDLGHELLQDFEATYRVIQERPRSFPLVTRKTRRALADRFPYAIYFQVEEDRVVITCVVHTARSPRVWKRRSK